MGGFDLADVYDDSTTYATYNNCIRPLTYETLKNMAILTLQNPKMEWNYYDENFDCWRYYVSNWGYGKSLPEKTMENKFIATKEEQKSEYINEIQADLDKIK